MNKIHTNSPAFGNTVIKYSKAPENIHLYFFFAHTPLSALFHHFFKFFNPFLDIPIVVKTVME